MWGKKIMEIIITQWALDSYLELIQSAFRQTEYWEIIRPDVLLLKNYPNEVKFNNSKFWSPVSDKGNDIADGFKMKWHNIGNGKNQLRLPVAVLTKAYLCSAYVKRNDKYEMRQLAKFKTYIQLLKEGRYRLRGSLS